VIRKGKGEKKCCMSVLVAETTRRTVSLGVCLCCNLSYFDKLVCHSELLICG